ncbi:MAG TPA: DUF2232 domain-containing protein [Syntrophomonadaceae bacterium]|nr:DUF2232 domain-containing protein [Syntrophomonadaceae bacterium]HOQ09986.1 DUF2232 domain-containing protein [Syntrophomonadaceae bacterium]HPU48391.1 DUF2232 domain-containing protein [Syntrophomonadaceae bacterium]
MTRFIKIALWTSAFALLMAAVPFLALPAAILWGSSLLIGALHLDTRGLTAIIILNVLIVSSLTGLNNTITLMCFFIIPAVMMSWWAQQGADYYFLQRWGVITAVIGVSLLLGWLYYKSGGLAMEQIEQQMQAQVEETIKYYEDSGMMALYEKQGLSSEEVKKALLSFMHAAIRHLPAFYYLQSIMAVFFMLFLASFWAQKRNLNRLIRKPFDQEIMPWQMAWVVIVGLVMWLWGRDQLSAIYYAGSNILLISVPIALYYGLAAIVYMIRRFQKRTRKILVIVLVVLSLLFTASAIIFLTVIGLFDSLLDYRRLRTKEE